MEHEEKMLSYYKELVRKQDEIIALKDTVIELLQKLVAKYEGKYNKN